MQAIEAILFDFDGTLIDSEPIHCACWREVLAPLGVPVTWEVYAAHCIGVPDPAMLEVFAKLCDPPVAPARMWQEHLRKEQMFRERMAADPPFPPDLAEFLAGLAATYQLGVVSSSTRGEIEPPLIARGLRGYLGTLVSGEDVSHPKPAPEPYLLAARNLGVRRALVVEDSVAGMESARAAGFPAIRVSAPSELMAAVTQRLALPDSASTR